MRLSSFGAASAALAIVMLGTSIAAAQEVQPPPPMNPPPSPQPQPIAPPPPMAPPGPAASPGAPGASPATPAEGAQSDTNKKLDEAEKKDSGRGFELFWIDGSIGGSYINMAQFSEKTFQIEDKSAGGPAFSIGAGVRLLVFVAGARLRYNALSSFNMWQINGEIGLKLPISSIDFLIGLHGGYSFVGRLGDAGAATNTNTPVASDTVSIRGFNGGLDVGIDYYVSPLFSVGVGGIADFLLLNRPPIAKPKGFELLPPKQQNDITNDPIYKESGTSAGLQLAAGLRLGLHFGL